MTLTGSTNAEKIWDYLIDKIGNAKGVAALMGNLYAESGLLPNNLQNSYESALGYTDATYTAAVDDGTYSNFVHDSAGYGLAQWTYYSRKQSLLNFAKAAGKSIGDMEMQLDFLVSELKSSYSSVWTALTGATDITTASNVVLTKFENPADQSSSVKAARASYGQKYYDQYAGGTANTATDTGSSEEASGEASGDVTYTVVKGDTLSAIAAKYGTTYQALASYNGISDPDVIYVGQAIKIPSSTSATSSDATYTVVKGDTLSAIAKKYGTTVSAIVAANKSRYSNITADYIQAGWTLTIPA